MADEETRDTESPDHTEIETQDARPGAEDGVLFGQTGSDTYSPPQGQRPLPGQPPKAI